jgi:hypothetical protein
MFTSSYFFTLPATPQYDASCMFVYALRLILLLTSTYYHVRLSRNTCVALWRHGFRRANSLKAHPGWTPLASFLATAAIALMDSMLTLLLLLEPGLAWAAWFSEVSRCWSLLGAWVQPEATSSGNLKFKLPVWEQCSTFRVKARLHRPYQVACHRRGQGPRKDSYLNVQVGTGQHHWLAQAY